MRVIKVRKPFFGFLRRFGFWMSLGIVAAVVATVGSAWLTVRDEERDAATVTHEELEEQLLSSSWTAGDKTFGVKRVYCDPEDVDENGVGIYRCQVNFQGRANEDMDLMRFDFDLQERWYTVG